MDVAHCLSSVDTGNFERNARDDHNYSKADYSVVVPNKIVEAVAQPAADMVDGTGIVVAVVEVPDKCLGGKEWHGSADLWVMCTPTCTWMVLRFPVPSMYFSCL